MLPANLLLRLSAVFGTAAPPFIILVVIALIGGAAQGQDAQMLAVAGLALTAGLWMGSLMIIAAHRAEPMTARWLLIGSIGSLAVHAIGILVSITAVIGLLSVSVIGFLIGSAILALVATWGVPKIRRDDTRG